MSGGTRFRVWLNIDLFDEHGTGQFEDGMTFSDDELAALGIESHELVIPLGELAGEPREMIEGLNMLEGTLEAMLTALGVRPARKETEDD